MIWCLVLGYVLGAITGGFLYSFWKRTNHPWETENSIWRENEWDADEWDDDHFDSLNNRGRDDPRENR